MDILKAPPPRPPIVVVSTTAEDLIKPLSNTVKEAYEYIFIESGSPDSYLSSSNVTTFINDTLYNTTIFSNNSSVILNDTNGGSSDDEAVGDLIIMAGTTIVLGLMILVTVIGNVFVIAAIILERNLQNVANYLVASLAVADLLVACLVMPLGAVYEISKGWILGPELCDIWTSCDVLCCTASILHLVAIATDRFWAVTNVDYMHSRTSKRVFSMIFLVWFASVIVSLAPQFGWKDPEYLQRIEQQKCMVSQDVGYQVFATCCTFYVPLLVILVLYWKIYQTARKRIHRRRPKLPISANNNQTVPVKTKSRLRFRLASKFTSRPGRSAVSSLGLVEGNSTNTVNTVEDTEDSTNTSNEKKGIEITTTFSDEVPSTSNQIATVSSQVENQTSTATSSQNNQSATSNNQIIELNQLTTPSVQNQNQNQNQISSQASTPVQHHTIPSTPTPSASISNAQSQVTKRKETLEAKRERKAAKTLAIITGAFVICWLPFFIMAITLPLCESCHINDSIASFFLWLGYFNSTLNPVIYTIFSPEFRQAFKRILFGAHRSAYYRGSKF